MDQKTRIYISSAFIAGIVLTLGFKDLYPDLERRFRKRWRRQPARTLAGAGLDNSQDSDPIGLEDHTRAPDGVEIKDNYTVLRIPEGIAACVGNTPLFKIRSLSEETGCEILAKAEVRLGRHSCFFFPFSPRFLEQRPCRLTVAV